MNKIFLFKMFIFIFLFSFCFLNFFVCFYNKLNPKYKKMRPLKISNVSHISKQSSHMSEEMRVDCNSNNMDKSIHTIKDSEAESPAN